MPSRLQPPSELRAATGSRRGLSRPTGAQRARSWGKEQWTVASGRLIVDGAATLALTYGLNTESGQSASVSISGPNAKYYDASVAKRSGFCCACAYFYPTVTLKNAT